MTGNRQGKFMTNDKGYDWDNQWGVGFELSQKEHYYHYLLNAHPNHVLVL